MNIDTEHNLYKLDVDGQTIYAIGMSIADVMELYDDASAVTKIEYIDTCYISPYIFNSLK